MQVGISAGRKELDPQQERDVVRVYFILAWVGYDANDIGASAVEQVNLVNLTGKHPPIGVGA